MKRCVIVGGARIRDYGRIKSYLRKDDFFIYCDGGLNHKNALGFEADLVAGDFDSFNLKDAPAGVELIKLPHTKTTPMYFLQQKLPLNAVLPTLFWWALWESGWTTQCAICPCFCICLRIKKMPLRWMTIQL